MLYNKVNKTDLTIFFYLKCRKKSTEGDDKNDRSKKRSRKHNIRFD